MALTPALIAECTEGKESDKVEALKVSGRSLSELCPLESFVNLHSIDVSSNKLGSLETAGVCAKITILDCQKNAITSLIGISAQFPSLRVINISENGISSCDGLESMNNLCAFIASNNLLSAIPPLQALKNLNTIILSNNKFTSFDGNLLPQSLTKLNLSHNELTAFPDLHSLTSLAELRLNSNKIESVPPEISGLKSLEVLEIGSNLISKIESIQPILALTQLKSLNVRGNELKDYISIVAQAIPELVILDSKRLMPKKRHFPEGHPMYTVKKEERDAALLIRYGPRVFEKRHAKKETEKGEDAKKDESKKEDQHAKENNETQNEKDKKKDVAGPHKKFDRRRSEERKSHGERKDEGREPFKHRQPRPDREDRSEKKKDGEKKRERRKSDSSSAKKGGEDSFFLPL